MIPNSFTYHRPASAGELFDLMDGGSVALLAGGTDMALALRDEKLAPNRVLDLKTLPELRGIRTQDGGLWLGAAEPVQDIAEHPLAQGYRALVEGAGSIGCYEIRHRATVGGNICNGSPSADSVPGLLLYDAVCHLISARGARQTPLGAFLLGPGKVDLRPGEVLAGVWLPPPAKGAQSRYYRRSRVKGMDLSGISAAVYCEGERNFRIALGAVWPTVARATQAEAVLNAKPFSRETLHEAVNVIRAGVSPRKGSLRASPAYKVAMIGALIEKAVGDMLGGDYYE